MELHDVGDDPPVLTREHSPVSAASMSEPLSSSGRLKRSGQLQGTADNARLKGSGRLDGSTKLAGRPPRPRPRPVGIAATVSGRPTELDDDTSPLAGDRPHRPKTHAHPA